MLNLAQIGGIPPEANQAVGQEAIALARRALEIRIQLYGLENEQSANAMSLLADALDYFNDVDDVEILRLYEQSIAITARVEGRMSVNVAVGENNFAEAYRKRATRARAANDLDRALANLELALPHHREAVRIYREINYVDRAEESAQFAEESHEELRRYRIASAAAAAASTSRG